MNKAIIPSLILMLFMLSCKKSNIGDPQEVKRNALEIEFNLKQVNNLPEGVKPTQFKTAEELETYLRQKNTYQTLKVTKLMSAKGSGKGKIASLDGNVSTGDGIGSVQVDGNVLGIGDVITYTSTIISPFYFNNAYPSIFLLSWVLDTGTNQITSVNQTVSYPGYNFGSFTYYQVSGSGSGSIISSKINTSGSYTEYYGIGGLYTYSKVWRLDLEANYINGSLTATINFTKMDV